MTATATPRGTKTSRSTTKALQPGMVVLTRDSQANPQFALNTDRKTGSVLRVVSHKTQQAPGEYQRQVRTVVHFTDGKYSSPESSSTTWMVAALAPVDVEPVATPEVPELSPADRAAVDAIQEAKAAKTFACACCNLPTQGGNYLPGHDARHASQVAAKLNAGSMSVERAAAILSPRLLVKALRQAGLQPL